MSTVRDRQEREVGVEYSCFCFQEADDDFVPLSFPGERETAEVPLLTEHEGRVDVSSAGHTHTALLTLEVWDGEPPAAGGEGWDEQGEVSFLSQTGELEIWSITGPAARSVDLGLPATRWKVRVYCSGREEVAHLATQGVPHGVERYLAQFWPACTGA